jgi:hypothetical protein
MRPSSDWAHCLRSGSLVTSGLQWQSVTSALDALKCDLCPSQTVDLLHAQVCEPLRCRAIEWLLATAAKKMAERSKPDPMLQALDCHPPVSASFGGLAQHGSQAVQGVSDVDSRLVRKGGFPRGVMVGGKSCQEPSAHKPL